MPTQEEIRIFDAANKFHHILSPENDFKSKLHFPLYRPNGSTKSSSEVSDDQRQSFNCKSQQNRYSKTVRRRNISFLDTTDIYRDCTFYYLCYQFIELN